MQLGDNLQTTCLHCGSVFRITPDQLEMARGQARCSQCNQIFNALFSLENYTEHDPQSPAPVSHLSEPDHRFELDSQQTEQVIKSLVDQPVSLNEAMYGNNTASEHHYKPVYWVIGIILMLIFILVQIIYYQRYPLLSSPQYQQQILNICQLLPCDEDRFISLAQINLIERHVFSHPTRDNALMITGSFINRAPFAQPLPKLQVSLSDIQGNLIANRQFTAEEYLAQQNVHHVPAGKAIPFRLEIFDPGTQALTYEFEFVS